MNEADRKAFEEWYDRAIDDDGRMEPIDVWEAALQHARRWLPISEKGEKTEGEGRATQD